LDGHYWCESSGVYSPDTQRLLYQISRKEIKARYKRFNIHDKREIREELNVWVVKI